MSAKENAVEEIKRNAREEAVAEIQQDEIRLRQEERDRLIQEAQEVAKGIKEGANQEAYQKIEDAKKEKKRIITEANDEADRIKNEAYAAISAREQAVKEREDAATKAVERARLEEDTARRAQTRYQTETLQALSSERNSRDADFDKIRASLVQRIEDLAQQRAELESERDELADESAFVRELKKKYQTASPERLQELEDRIQQLTQFCEERQQKIKDLQSQLDETKRATDGLSLADTRRRLDEAEARCNRLDEELAERPSLAEIKQMEQDASDLTRLRSENSELYDKVIQLQTQLSAAAYTGRELDIARMEAKALRTLNDQMMERLRYFSQAYETAREDKFAGLLEIDAELEKNRTQSSDASFQPFDSLERLTHYIHEYAASKGFFYEEKTIRVFLASMAASYDSSRLILLQGLSGTGKSSLPRIVAEAIGAKCRFVSVQPSWRDNRELLGYDNDFTHRFKETEFTKILYQASADPDTIWFVVLDEVNLARIEYYFADFLSELERQTPTGWSIPLISNYQSEGERTPRHLLLNSGTASLVIRKNVWFIGTANNDDSTATITDKVYDRAQILDMDQRAAEKRFGPIDQRIVSLANLESLFAAARKSSRNTISQDLLDEIDYLDIEFLQAMDITFGNRIKMQLQAFAPIYVAAGGTKNDAIDYYLAHKILRRLDERYDIYIPDILKSMIEYLHEKFGEHTFSESENKIKILKRKNFSGGGNE